jgi:hypothetical protein
MNNAFLRLGYTCVCAIIAAAGVTSATAAERDLATVTLPQAVEVGDTTLAAGQYTIVEEGEGTFRLSAPNGQGAVVLGRPFEEENEANKTQVVLTKDGKGLRLDKLYIEGENTGIEFER